MSLICNLFLKKKHISTSFFSSDDPATSYGYLSNTNTADSNPNQIYKPCTKRPPLYPGGARQPQTSYSRWRAGLPETKGVTISFFIIFKYIIDYVTFYWR